MKIYVKPKPQINSNQNNEFSIEIDVYHYNNKNQPERYLKLSEVKKKIVNSIVDLKNSEEKHFDDISLFYYDEDEDQIQIECDGDIEGAILCSLKFTDPDKLASFSLIAEVNFENFPNQLMNNISTNKKSFDIQDEPHNGKEIVSISPHINLTQILAKKNEMEIKMKLERDIREKKKEESNIKFQSNVVYNSNYDDMQTNKEILHNQSINFNDLIEDVKTNNANDLESQLKDVIFKEIENTKERLYKRVLEELNIQNKQQIIQKIKHEEICISCKNYIEGIRYSCIICKNFDYCESCESINGKSHGHLFALYSTNQNTLDKSEKLENFNNIASFNKRIQSSDANKNNQIQTNNTTQSQQTLNSQQIKNTKMTINQDDIEGSVILYENFK